MSHAEQATLEEWMRGDEYDLVQYSLAIALEKRGNIKPHVLDMAERARDEAALNEVGLGSCLSEAY